MTRLIALILAAVAVAGCATPSVHSIASADKKISDPALVGTWRQSDDRGTYTISVERDHYLMVADNRDAQDPHKWSCEVRLIQLGKHRFADIQASEKSRHEIDEQWGPFFIPAHLFCRYSVDGDNLRVWILSNEWLGKQAAGGRPANTRIDHDWTLLTADTRELQAFLESAADNAAAFDVNELKRVKP